MLEAQIAAVLAWVFAFISICYANKSQMTMAFFSAVYVWGFALSSVFWSLP